jgi:serine/threonine-protein kinase
MNEKHSWVPLEPARLDEYTLVARLGQGGMAEICLAVHHGLSAFRKLVVIKRLLPHMAARSDVVGMFLDEARLAARLSHPNIVETTKIGTSGGHYYITMEFVDGQPANRIFQRAARQPIPPDVSAKIVSDALAGLHHAHESTDFDGSPLHVVHRDVSPHNLMVGYDGTTKILDFGIATATLHLEETQTGIIKGKFGYIAPEQALGANADRLADIWSAGVVLWECLTGQRLFNGTDIATLREVITKELVDVREVRPELPFELAEICNKALQRDTSLRYPTALAMKNDIDNWLRTREAQSADHVARFLAETFESEHRQQRLLVKAITSFSDDSRAQMRDLGADSSANSLPEIALALGGTSTQTVPLRGTPLTSDDRSPTLLGRGRVLQAGLLLLTMFVSAGIAWWGAPREVESIEEGSLLARAPTAAAASPALDSLPPNSPPLDSPLVRSFTLSVESEPSGATLYRDGSRIGTTPMNLSLEVDVLATRPTEMRLELDGFHDYVWMQRSATSDVAVRTALSPITRAARPRGRPPRQNAPPPPADQSSSPAEPSRPPGLGMPIKTRR